MGVDASVPMARARCCVTISPGAFRPHAPRNSCSLRSSRPSTGKANNITPGALTRIGLRACSSAKARLTLRCSSLPNRAEFAGECAAFIYRTFFYWARSWNTESPEFIPLEIRWISRIDWPIVSLITRENRISPCSLPVSPPANLLLPTRGRALSSNFVENSNPCRKLARPGQSCSGRCAPGRWMIS